METDKIICCDVTKGIPLPDKSVQCVVTSPPYWGLRDYGTAKWEGGDPECDHIDKDKLAERKRQQKSMIAVGERTDGSTRTRVHDETIGKEWQYRNTCAKCGAKRIDRQLGLEKTPEEYIERMVAVFRHVWRVLRDDGTCWVNMGDSYANDSKWGGETGGKHAGGLHGKTGIGRRKTKTGLKSKDLCMMPARLAIALQADGWYLRSDIIWAKPNPMPESVTDRPTKSHEHLFLLTKKPKYFYDADAVREEHADPNDNRPGRTEYAPGHEGEVCGAGKGRMNQFNNPAGRNKRDVWTIPTQACDWDYCLTCEKLFTGSERSKIVRKDDSRLCPQCKEDNWVEHFATFPEKLVQPCIKAGTSEKGCCPECGSPWVRVVEKENMVIDRSNRGEQLGKYGKTAASGAMVSPAKTTTIGWKPTCKCFGEFTGLQRATSIPCTVYDPFGGSMTTCLVAYKLNRHYIATELSQEYIEMGRKRIGAEKEKYSLLEG